MFIGESLVGERPNGAHINLYIGPRTGPVGTAMASAAAAPRLGYIPFMAILKPNVPVKPITLFCGKADLRGELHETLNWGPAQIGVSEPRAQRVAQRGRILGRNQHARPGSVGSVAHGLWHASDVGGECTIESAPGSGTRVRCAVPFASAPSAIARTSIWVAASAAAGFLVYTCGGQNDQGAPPYLLGLLFLKAFGIAMAIAVALAALWYLSRLRPKAA